MKGKIIIGLLAGLGMSLSAATHAQQNAWDAVGDFNPTTNPNGWTYSWQPAEGGPLEPMVAGGNCGLEGIACWTRSGGYTLPLIGLNNTMPPSPIELPSGVIPLSVLLLHPGPSNERAVVTWTAPPAPNKVRYLVTGHFQLLDYHNFHYFTKLGLGLPGVNVSVTRFKGSVEQEKKSAKLTKFGESMKFDFDKCLKPGETISLMVDANGNYANDLTALKVGILRSREFDEANPEQQPACSGPG